MNQSISYEIAAVVPAAVASGLPVSTVTIQQPSGALDAAGAPTGAYTDVPGMVAVKNCMRAPFITGERMVSDEFKALPEQAAMLLEHLWMPGNYKTILAGWRAIVDGSTYDVLGIEWDSQSQMTRLKIQVLNV